MDQEKEKMSVNPEKDKITEMREPKAAPEVSETAEAQTTEAQTETNQSTIFAKHVYNTKKPAKNGNIKRIAICITAFVLCGAIIAGVLLVNRLIPDDAASSTPSIAEEESFDILTLTDIVKPSYATVNGEQVEVDTNIESVYFVNGYDDFVCKPYFVEAAEDESSSSNTSEGKTSYLYDTKWYIDGIDRELTVSDAIYSVIKGCLSVKGFRVMENTFASVEEYHEYYGMKDKLTAGCVFRFNDGTETLTVSVGDVLATGDAYYFMTSLSDTVYVVSSSYVEKYFSSSKEFADSTVITPIEKNDGNSDYFNKNGDLARFDTIKVYGGVFGDKTYEFKMAAGASADYMPYLMAKPYERPANNEFISKILGFADDGLEASAFYSYSVTDKDIEECGFDDPKCVVELTVGDYSFKLIIGGYRNDDTDSMTAMVDGKPQVFGVDVDYVAFLVNASNDITKMFNEDFILEDIYTVKSFEMKTVSGTHRFDLTHTLREGETKVYDTVVKNGGTVMDTQSFKLIYQRVLMLSLMEYVTEAKYSEPVLSVTFNYVEGGPSKTVEFTVSSDDIYHYVAWVDGVPLGEVLKSSVDDILTCLNTYLAGGQVPDTW